MIKQPIIEIGQFNKTHGINGEISASVDVDVSLLSCIVVNMDGIDVPFFINSVRPKGRDAVLLKIDGYDSEQQVKPFVNKYIYALASEVETVDHDEDGDDGDGFKAADLIGFKAVDTDDAELGTIDDIDDNTDNVLFVLSRPGNPKPLLVPVADEFIAGIDTEARTITLSLPEGLLDL